jgi:hypothetical protein
MENLYQNSIQFAYNLLSALQPTMLIWKKDCSNNVHTAEAFSQQHGYEAMSDYFSDRSHC